MIAEGVAAGAGLSDMAALGMINAGAQAGNNLFGMLYNDFSSKKQREWSEKMYNQQNAWNEEMWNKQNEYNDPANQVQRLRDAGLNPMFYGLDGTGNAGSLTAAQPLGYDRASAPNLVNPVGSLLSAMEERAKIDNIMANTAKQTEETTTEVYHRLKVQQETENLKQQAENLKATQSLTEAQTRQVDKVVEWSDRLNEAAVNESKARAALSQSQKKEIDELLENKKILQQKEISNFDKEWQIVDAQLREYADKHNLAQKDVEFYAINHLSNGFMGTGLSLQNILRAAIAEAARTADKEARSGSGGKSSPDSPMNTPSGGGAR